jgi:predicted MFS family arabinose efflux permease
LWQTARSPAIAGLSGILLLWNFNPCSTTIVHLHLTGPLGLSEPLYGQTVSVMAMASLVASLLYATYCRRVPMRWLLHASIVLGIVSNLAYSALFDARSALVVTFIVGFTSMTALLVQLDLAARFSPPEVAGTTFALLMAFANLGLILATWLGGAWYERSLSLWGHTAAFQLMAVVGAVFTALCWFLVPLIPDPTAAHLRIKSLTDGRT